MVLELAGGAHCYLEKSLELGISSSATSFSNIRGYRRPRPPDLGHHTEDFLFGKPCGHCVAIESKLVGFLPNFQITKIFHALFLKSTILCAIGAVAVETICCFGRLLSPDC